MWIWSVVLVPALVPALVRSRTHSATRASGTTIVRLALGVAGVVLAIAVGSGTVGTGAGFVWLRAGSFTLSAGLRVDALSGMLGLATLVGAILALGPEPGSRRRPLVRARLVGLVMSAHLLVLLADSLWLLLVGWELVGLGAARMLDEARGPGRGGRAALLTSRAGSLALLLAAAILVRQTGTLGLDGLVDGTAMAGSGAGALAVTALLVAATATRVGLVPLHGWLVRGGARPGTVGALHAGVLWTSGVYLLARLHPLMARGAVVLALGAGLGVVTALSLFLAACLVPRRRMPAFLAPAHAGLVVAALCCGGGVGAVAWTAALAPLLVAVALLSPADPRAAHGAAILGALVAVLWIGLPGLGPAVVLRSRALASLALPPVGGVGLAIGAAAAVALAAVAAVRWLSGERAGPAADAGALARSAVAVVGLLAVGVATLVGFDAVGALAAALGPLTGSLADLRGARHARLWLLAPGMAALAGAMAAAAGRLMPGLLARIAGSRTARGLRVAASRGWYVHEALRVLLLRPVLSAAVALGSPADGDVPVGGTVAGRPAGAAAGLFRGFLLLLFAAATGWRTVADTGGAISGIDGIVAAVLMAVTGLAVLEPRTGRRTAVVVAMSGIATAVAALLPPGIAWVAWWPAVAGLVLAAHGYRTQVARALLPGVVLLTVAVAAGPPAAAMLPALAAPPGWRLLVLVIAVTLLVGTMPAQAWRARTLAKLPPGATVLLAAGWPLAGLHALLRYGAWLDPAGWAGLDVWLPMLGAALIVVAGPLALAQASGRRLAVQVHGATIGWALIGIGTWTRSSVTGVALVLVAQALWLAGWLLASRPGGADRSAARERTRAAPPAVFTALAAGGAYPGLLLILVDSHRAAPQSTLVALAATLLLALPLREAVAGDHLHAGIPSPGRLRVAIAVAVAAAPALWPAPLAQAAYRDLDRVLVPVMPFRPADPDVDGPDRVAAVVESAEQVAKEEEQVGRALREPAHEPRIPGRPVAHVDAHRAARLAQALLQVAADPVEHLELPVGQAPLVEELLGAGDHRRIVRRDGDTDAGLSGVFGTEAAEDAQVVTVDLPLVVEGDLGGLVVGALHDPDRRSLAGEAVDVVHAPSQIALDDHADVRVPLP